MISSRVSYRRKFWRTQFRLANFSEVEIGSEQTANAAWPNIRLARPFTKMRNGTGLGGGRFRFRDERMGYDSTVEKILVGRSRSGHRGIRRDAGSNTYHSYWHRPFDRR